MNYSTAASRLDGLVMFWLARKAGLAVCFRCGKDIGTKREFSIDHKQSWLDVDPKLFWDVENNIAFSHLKCNIQASRKTKPSESYRGSKNSQWGKRGKDSANFGSKRSPEVREKIRLGKLGSKNPNFGQSQRMRDIRAKRKS